MVSLSWSIASGVTESGPFEVARKSLWEKTRTTCCPVVVNVRCFSSSKIFMMKKPYVDKEIGGHAENMFEKERCDGGEALGKCLRTRKALAHGRG